MRKRLLLAGAMTAADHVIRWSTATGAVIGVAAVATTAS
jgi:hypothetical protein